MRPIMSIVGNSNSGKTTLIESLIIELKQRGYKVAVIKHAGEDFELDKAGKDSWRFSQAGSGVVAISSPHKFAVIKPVERGLSPQELSRFIGWDYDLLLTEGFRQSNNPKIEIHRKELDKELSCHPNQLLAIVTDEPLDVNVPQFTRDDIQDLASLIENWLLAHRQQDDVDLFINDAPVPIKPFVKNFLIKTLLGMVSTLKGVKEIRSLYISLRRKG